MSKLIINESTLTSIGDAIRNKEGSTEKIPPLEMGDRIRAIQTGGVNYVDYMQRCTFASLNLFGTKKLEITLPNGNSLLAMFSPTYATREEYEAAVNTSVEELVINCPNPVGYLQQFYSNPTYASDKTLRKITFNVDFSAMTHLNSAFQNIDALEIIDGNPINLTALSGQASSFITGCNSLREIRFTGVLSQTLTTRTTNSLSRTSIESIMACLSANTTDKTLALSAAAVDKAFETSEGANDGSTSAEWTALVDAHTNWTISLI